MADMTERMMNAFTELPRIDSPPFRSALNPEYDDTHFWLSMHPANILRALHEARKAREVAVSYRDFLVGATTITLSRSPANFQILAGINAKTSEDTTLNMHAEQLALKKAAAYGGDMISVVAVVGETQADKQSGHDMHTLHPCGLCREAMAENELVRNDDTLIFTALPDLRTIEVSTVNGLRAYHDATDPDPSRVTLIELPEMEILTPYTPPKDGVVRLQDNDQTTEEDRLWSGVINGVIYDHRSKRNGFGVIEQKP